VSLNKWVCPFNIDITTINIDITTIAEVTGLTESVIEAFLTNREK